MAEVLLKAMLEVEILQWKSLPVYQKKHLPNKLFIPELFDLEFRAWHSTWKHLK